jgi:outer membrane lipoprotein SlyB
MGGYQQPTLEPRRKTPHPAITAAATSVAAVALLVAAQMLRPTVAASQGVVRGQATATAAPSVGLVALSCPGCGVVLAVRETRQAGEGTGVGAVTGGVVGGVVGHQFGSGHGNDAITIAGAVGGAVAGHQIEKQARATSTYHVDVRLNDGTTRTFDYADPPPFTTGAKIRVKDGQLLPRG